MSYRLCFLATIIVGIACDQPCVPLLQFANAVRHTSASLFLALPSSMKCCPATPVVLQHNMGLSKTSLPHCMTLSPCIVTLLNRLDSAVISSGMTLSSQTNLMGACNQDCWKMYMAAGMSGTGTHQGQRLNVLPHIASTATSGEQLLHQHSYET